MIVFQKISKPRNVTTVDTLMDLARNLFPSNLFRATLKQYRTNLVYPDPSSGLDPLDKYTWDIKGEYTNGSNILGLALFAVVVGLAIGHLGEKGRPLLEFFTSLSETMMLVTRGLICLAPVGVLSLIIGQVLSIDDLGQIIGKLGFYFMTVLLGLFIHGFVILPLIFVIFTQRLPFR